MKQSRLNVGFTKLSARGNHMFFSVLLITAWPLDIREIRELLRVGETLRLFREIGTLGDNPLVWL